MVGGDSGRRMPRGVVMTRGVKLLLRLLSATASGDDDAAASASGAAAGVERRSRGDRLIAEAFPSHQERILPPVLLLLLRLRLRLLGGVVALDGEESRRHFFSLFLFVIKTPTLSSVVDFGRFQCFFSRGVEVLLFEGSKPCLCLPPTSRILLGVADSGAILPLAVERTRPKSG